MNPDAITHGAADEAGALFAINTVDFDTSTAEESEHLAVLLSIFLELQLSALFILLGFRLLAVLTALTSLAWHH